MIWGVVKYNACDDIQFGSIRSGRTSGVSWNAVKNNAFDATFNSGAFALEICCAVERCKIQCC